MVLHIKDVKDLCSKILAAVDSGDGTAITETLELVTKGNTLYANVTNNEYYVQYKLKLDDEISFHATVKAETFLKLVQMMTTETVELTVDAQTLVVRGNGEFTLPLIFQGENLLQLPVIEVKNVTNEFDVDTSVFTSILNYNDKELNKDYISIPIHKLFYVDNTGAITHTKYGACINSFTLPEEIKVTFNQKFVKLFKLFDSTPVHLTLGREVQSDTMILTRIKLETDTLCITSILSSNDDYTALYSTKATKIRSFAIKEYPYSVTINKDMILQALNRFLVFNTNSLKNTIGTFKFEGDSVVISDASQKNYERVVYSSNNTDFNGSSYINHLDFKAIKSVLDTCIEPEVTISFGDQQAVTVSHGNITNVIQERRA